MEMAVQKGCINYLQRLDDSKNVPKISTFNTKASTCYTSSMNNEYLINGPKTCFDSKHHCILQLRIAIEQFQQSNSLEFMTYLAAKSRIDCNFIIFSELYESKENIRHSHKYEWTEIAHNLLLNLYTNWCSRTMAIEDSSNSLALSHYPTM